MFLSTPFTRQRKVPTKGQIFSLPSCKSKELKRHFTMHAAPRSPSKARPHGGGSGHFPSSVSG